MAATVVLTRTSGNDIRDANAARNRRLPAASSARSPAARRYGWIRLPGRSICWRKRSLAMRLEIQSSANSVCCCFGFRLALDSFAGMGAPANHHSGWASTTSFQPEMGRAGLDEEHHGNQTLLRGDATVIAVARS